MGKIGHWIYQINEDDTARFVLGEIGHHTIGCIGINPSTASPNNLDNTLKSVKRIARFNGFDGWVMFNIYPQRATNPKEMHHSVNKLLAIENYRTVQNTVENLNIDIIWLAYGNLIETRPYLSSCLEALIKATFCSKIKWKTSNSLTLKGHPRHPLYLPTDSKLDDFNIKTLFK